MKTIPLFNDCLTFEQLQAYASHKSNKSEDAQTYMHISSCELCACAVNGFAAIPFSLSDVDAIHNQIDVKINATHASPLTFARVIIVVVSLASIFGFYHFADSYSENKMSVLPKENTLLPLSSGIEIRTKKNPLAVLSHEHSVSGKRNRSVFIGSVKKIFIPMEPVKSITATLPEPLVNNKDIVNSEIFNADVIYIYDLKVTEYQNLYFSQKILHSEMKGATPSFKEYKNASNDLPEPDYNQTVAADKVLKKGLEYFNKGKYTKAISEFQLLLDLNSKDINSLFYSAVSYYQTGKYTLAMNDLEAVLKSDNNVFHPEAKWNLALVNIKTEDKIKAKELLNEIVFEKGFYAKKAADKLKGL